MSEIISNELSLMNLKENGNPNLKYTPMELLAPAGGFEALKAAIENGANAVYLGGKSFNARASAANFDLEELERAIKYAHEREVKIYVTVNILIADSEIPELSAYLYKLYLIGVDAVILQDLGVADLMQTILPEMEIHASTQMTINNSWAVRHLEKAGFARVVMARENSAAEMRVIGESTPLDLEVFVHGALCISYSGQCLMSSFIGGRSGNRGRCAQPCRLPYQLVDLKDKNVLQEQNLGEHLLSPKDLNLVEELFLLKNAGVNSLKIEGRMKRPEYVATVTRVYRKALDYIGRDLSEGEEFREDKLNNHGLRVVGLSDEDRYELLQIFNRDFTKGYLGEHPGMELMSYHRPNNRGTRLGRVMGMKEGYLMIKLEAPLRLGDGIEVWTTKGRAGVTVDNIRLNQKGFDEVEEGKSGETVGIRFPGWAKPGDRVFKTHDERLMEKARRSFQEGKEQRKRPLNLVISGKVGEHLELEARDGEHKVKVFSQTPAQQALKRPLTLEYLSSQLGRLGNTPFFLDHIRFEFEGEGMIPVSELNEMRRVAVEALLNKDTTRPQLTITEYQKRVETWEKELKETSKAVKSSATFNAKMKTYPQLSVAVSDIPAVKAALKGGATRILFGGENWRSRQGLSFKEIKEAHTLCHEHDIEGVWRLPRILNQSQSQNLTYRLREIAQWENKPVVMPGNLGALEIIKEIDPSWPFAIDYSLNVFNEASTAHFFNQGAKVVTLSPELHHEQIKKLSAWPNLEVLVFGDMEMMISEYCPVGATLGGKKGERCSAPCVQEPYFLKDRMSYTFPLETDQECRMHLFNIKRLNLIEELPQLAEMGINRVRLQLIRVEPKAVREITRAFRAAWDKAQGVRKGTPNFEREKRVLDELFPEGFTKGHFFRGII